MELRMDKDEVVYIDDIKRQDRYIIFPSLNRKKWRLESRKFGHIKTFDSQVTACFYVKENLVSDE